VLLAVFRQSLNFSKSFLWYFCCPYSISVCADPPEKGSRLNKNASSIRLVLIRFHDFVENISVHKNLFQVCLRNRTDPKLLKQKHMTTVSIIRKIDNVAALLMQSRKF